MRRKFTYFVAALALTFAACGSDDKNSDGTTAGGATAVAQTTTPGGSTESTTPSSGGGGVDEAKATVEGLLASSSSINIDIPLDGKPEAGKKVFWLEGNVEDIRAITKGYEEATALLNWELTTLTYDTADPQSVNAAMQQAVDQGADYIAVSGVTAANFDLALENAKAKGIPVFDMYSDNEIGGEENGIYTNTGGLAETQRTAPYVADWAIADSGGKADIAFFNLPDFKILQVLEEAFAGEISAKCPDCKYDAVDSTINDLVSGAIPSQVVSYVQTHPDTKYLGFAIGQQANGVREALETAGVGDDVKIFGGNPNSQNVQALIDGKEQAWLALPRESSAWNVVDAMARYSEGMDLAKAIAADLPRQIWTPDNVPKPAAEYIGVEGYQELWKALWLID